MNPELIPVIRWFLEDLADRYGNAGANDVMPDLERLLTDDVRKILRPYMEDPGDWEFNFDFCIVHAIRAYLKEVQP